jgi:hypothetical protein
MAYPGIGYKSYFQFGREAVYGTGVAATHRLPVKSIRPRYQQGLIRSNVLNNRVARSDIYEGGENVRVEIEFEMCYTGRLFLLDGLFGTATYGANGCAPIGGGPYTYGFTPLEVLNSYTLELIMGNIPAGKCEQVVGAKISEASFRCAAGLEPEDGVMNCRMTFVGKSVTTNVTPTGALTATTPDPVLMHHMTADDTGTADSSSSVNLLDFELTMRNALADQRFYMGSQNIDEPIRNGFLESVLRVRQEFQTRTALDEYLARTKGTPTLTFSTGASATFSINVYDAVMRSFDHEASQAGVLEQTFEYEGTDDGSGSGGGVGISVTNNQATVAA